MKYEDLVKAKDDARDRLATAKARYDVLANQTPAEVETTMVLRRYSILGPVYAVFTSSVTGYEYQVEVTKI